MSEKVEGNRVTIEGSPYIIKPAGKDRWSVSNDFGEALGYFMVRGKTVTADDFRVKGAHPLQRIGRVWNTGNEVVDSKPAECKMVCEVHTLAALQPADLDAARAHRRWLKDQPGLKASFYAHDAASGKALSIRVWATRAQLDACKAKAPPDGAKDLPSSGVDILSLVEDL